MADIPQALDMSRQMIFPWSAAHRSLAKISPFCEAMKYRQHFESTIEAIPREGRYRSRLIRDLAAVLREVLGQLGLPLTVGEERSAA
jgi:hypothetical protein